MGRTVKDHKAPGEEADSQATFRFDRLASIPITSCRKLFQISQSNAGSKTINPLTLCVIFALQWVFGRSDKKLESQVNGRRSIEKYIGPDMMKGLPAKPTPPI